MKTRAFVSALAFSALVLGSGVSAFAYHGYGHPYGGPNGMASIPSDRQDAYDAMMKEHYDRVSPLRDKLESKQIELDALSRNPNAKPESISALANEVAQLRSQIRSERISLGDRMEKEIGVRGGRGMGGRGMGGYGGYHHGGGYGHGHGGYGHGGNCAY